MAFTKITDEDRSGLGNVGQPDTPGLTTAEMQAVMDELPNLAIDKFNDHIDELEAEAAATSLGAAVPTGLTASANIQSIINAFYVLIAALNNSKHSHANKTTIDAITATVKENYDALVLLFTGIVQVASTVTNATTSIPTCNAVKTYADNLDVSEKVVNGAYPVGVIYCSSSNVNPSGTLGYGTWVQVGSADSDGVYRFRRTA